MYYGFIANGIDYVISSKKIITKRDDLQSIFLTPKTEKLYNSNFPVKKIPAYLKNQTEINISSTYQRLLSYVHRYVQLRNDNESHLVSVWAMSTYVFKMFRVFPYLHLFGEKASGKTTLMEILQPIVFNGDLSSNSSAAVIYRDVDLNTPTLFIDEYEKQISKTGEVQKALLDVLKTGFGKAGAVKRCVGEGNIPQKFDSYSPKVIAGINEIDDVLADRTIKIRMVRKLKDSHVKRYTNSIKNLEEQQQLRDEQYFVGLENAYKMYELYESMNPDEDQDLIHLSNRSFEIWCPLIVVAKVIDLSNHALNVSQKLIELSKSYVTNKGINDSIANESVILANFFLDLIKFNNDRCIPIRTEDTWMGFDTDDVLNEINSQVILGRQMSKNALSRLLNDKLNISPKAYQSTNYHTTKKMYVVNLKDFLELQKSLCSQ
ncbi:MAG: hypothetical protein M1495_22720 [Bacteroidetes bacterium]|nr:hypothetical protein [Bacteroidota bacterium]